MKVLIVRFSSIGDIILTTPIVKALYEQRNDITIHYLTKQQFLPLLSKNPNINKIHTFQKSLKEVIEFLKNEKYDYLIDLHNNLRTLILKKALKIPHRSFRKLNVQKWLLVNFHYRKMPQLHVVDRYFETLNFLGVTNKLHNCELFLSDADIVDTYKKWNIPPYTYLSVAIGAQFGTKTMPVSLIINILNKVNCSIILLGGKNDRKRSEEITDALIKNNKTVINAVDQLSITESAYIVAMSKTILTHDTGLMHIATAFDIPIVSVWGNTVPELGMYPYYPKKPEKYSIHQVKELPCRPCSKIGHHKCPKKHFHCMTLQNVEVIYEDINKRMKQ